MITVKVVFGKEQVQKALNNIPIERVEKEQYEKAYSFNTEGEIEAFIKGTNEAVGWQEVYISEELKING